MALSYFQKRLKELGINKTDDQRNTLNILDPDTGKPVSRQLFMDDGKGNFLIRYYDFNGRPYHLKKRDGVKWDKPFDRIRLSNPIGSQKYISPSGNGLRPYLTKDLIQHAAQGKKIQTLFLIEGELKAHVAGESGLFTIGLGSNHGFYAERENDSNEKKLHPEILKAIELLEPQNLCLLLDADTLSVNYKYGKELSDRPRSFCTSVTNFWRVTNHLMFEGSSSVKNIYFGHIQGRYDPEHKGMDDLLLGKPEKAKSIVGEAKKLTEDVFENSYFFFKKLDQNYYTWAQQYFGLDSVESFYEKYRTFIGEKEFLFKNAIYFCPENGKPRFLYHNDVKKFFRIGTSWMKNIQKPDKFGDLVEQIIPFSISEISRDYPQNKFPGFIDQINRYDAYCNEPMWTSEYKREISGCYNLANPIAHKAQRGGVDFTIKFLKHIFQGEGSLEKVINENGAISYQEDCITGDSFTVGLDYLTLMFQNPKQMLPVPILVSKEYGTGKSTFLKWLKIIFGSNMAILNNEQFKMRFNGHYITKFIIAIDEGFLDVDKKAEKERLKQLVTSDTQLLEFKGVDLQEFYYYGKVILCSNDADSVMKMEDDENRWFVLKVPPIPEEEKDPDSELKLKEEVPAWLNFLMNRKVHHKKESRLWFKDEHFITDQFQEIVKNTKSRAQKTLEEVIVEMFQTYRYTPLKLSLAYITKMVNDSSKYKVDKVDVKKILKENLGILPEDRQRIKYPVKLNAYDGNEEMFIEFDKDLQRPYVFHIEDWIPQEEMENWDIVREQESNEKSKLPI